MSDTKRLCPACESPTVEHCPEDPEGRERCETCGARFHGAVRVPDGEKRPKVDRLNSHPWAKEVHFDDE